MKTDFNTIQVEVKEGVAVLNMNNPPVNQLSKHFMADISQAMEAAYADEDIKAMVSLEMLGCFSDEEGSQHYPFPFGLFYPHTGNFIGFVGNLSSRRLVRRALRAFRTHTRFPSEGCAAPGWITGIGWSDHWGFWQAGYPAIMVTDTAFFRYGHYHMLSDTPDKIDYERAARVVVGLTHVMRDLAGNAGE